MATKQSMEERLAQLEAENAKLKAKSERAISFKVSEKGGLSVYGLGRFPVTLYKEQWARLIENIDGLKESLADNDDKLKAKE